MPTPYDPTFGTPADVDADMLDYDDRDQLEAHDAVAVREIVTGLPARPGVIR